MIVIRALCLLGVLCLTPLAGPCQPCPCEGQDFDARLTPAAPAAAEAPQLDAAARRVPRSPLEVDAEEVLRLGALVQHVAPEAAAADEGLYVQAMGPPADDSHKWFVSVLSRRDCPACLQLREDWSRHPSLLALAVPDAPRDSWAHFAIYDLDDQSQAFRFEKLRVAAVPTIVVQPPRNGAFGPPATVVYQGTYGGDPHALAVAICAAIRRYCATLAHVAPPTPGPAQEERGIDPPWSPTPRPSPTIPRPFDGQPREPFKLPIDIPPVHVEHEVSTSYTTILAIALPVLGAAAAAGLWWLRQKRTVAGKPTLPQSEFDQLLDLLQGKPPQPPKTEAELRAERIAQAVQERIEAELAKRKEPNQQTPK